MEAFEAERDGGQAVSSFEAESDRLTGRIGQLALPAQVGLFAAAAKALMPRYQDWVAESQGLAVDRSDLLRKAMDRAFQFAAGDATSTSAADLAVHSTAHVTYVTAELNDRPRKGLCYDTPAFRFAARSAHAAVLG